MSEFPIVEGGCRHRLRSLGPYGPTWPCNEPRWHWGRHRFRNYTWPRVPQLWRVSELWQTRKANGRLRGMGADRSGLMRPQAVLYPKRFDPLPVGEGGAVSDLAQKISERCEARADDLLFQRHAQVVAVIRAVLARHRSVGVPAACEWCEEDWPCVTVLDVASALGVREDPED